MKYLISTICILLIGITKAFGQKQPATNDSIYAIQDSVFIPTRSGIDISAIIVHKKTNKNQK